MVVLLLLSSTSTSAAQGSEQCGPPRTLMACPHPDRYRSISGVCNNRDHPEWGSAHTALQRWLPAQYEDGQNQPRGWSPELLYSGFTLPPVSEVSARLLQGSGQAVLEDELHSQLLVDWGQYVAHDISFTPQSSASEGLDCGRSCSSVAPCFPAQVFRPLNPGDLSSCLSFFRSAAACPDAGTQRQQLNAATSFIDASTVYGSSAAVERSVRCGSGGRLAVSGGLSDGGHSFLPPVSPAPSPCLQRSGAAPDRRVECFRAGDSRVNEVLPLTVLHTLWVREHNRLADRLALLNPHWGSEVVYQETRKIVVALHQIFTVRDYLPRILGPEACKQHLGRYRGYSNSVNPSAANVFSTAAFRFGHASVSPLLLRLNQSFQPHPLFPSLPLHSSFFSPWRLVREGGLDPVLRGLLARPATLQNQKQLMIEDLTERLLVLNTPHTHDLASLNLQRGRDHGLPGYNAWRMFCGLKPVETVAELMEVAGVSAARAETLLDVYGHMNNTDVWLGGLLERPGAGARTGPLLACLIGRQMKQLRDGDRWWWQAAGVFTAAQRRELQRHSLSRVVCDVSGLDRVPLDAFRRGTYPHDFLPCHDVPSLDLRAWRERDT